MSNEVRRSAKEGLRAGRLPDRHPDRMWGGHGNGSDPCTLCGKVLGPDDVSLDLEYGDPVEQPVLAYSVHLQCFSAWDDERRRPGASQAPPASKGNGSGNNLPGQSDHGTISGRGHANST
jgi:hypothetical protein